MQVYASIQAERSGRVYIIFQNINEYFWVRASPGMEMHGPFSELPSIFQSMSRVEGKSAEHWSQVFTSFYPNMPITQRRVLMA